MMCKGKEIPPEHLAIAKTCTTVEELIEKAKEGGIELTKTDAEEFLKMKDEIKYGFPCKEIGNKKRPRLRAFFVARITAPYGPFMRISIFRSIIYPIMESEGA